MQQTIYFQDLQNAHDMFTVLQNPLTTNSIKHFGLFRMHQFAQGFYEHQHLSKHKHLNFKGCPI